MHGERAHSKLGASSAKRWMNCPGSVALSETVPEPPPSPFADEGTAAHEVAEQCLKNGYEPEDFVSRFITITPGVNGRRVEVTPEMAEAVRVYVDCARMLFDLADDEKAAKIEHRFTLTQFDPALFGTNDCCIFNKRDGVLDVLDYKHGAGVPVDVQDNPQLKYYALGALLEAGPGVNKVRLTVVQPRCGGEPVRTWELTPLDLLEFGADLAEAAAKTREPNAPLASGDWCKFCRAAPVCPQLARDALAVAGVEFEDVTADKPLPAPADLPDLGARLAVADKLEMWLKAVRAFAYDEAKRGNPPAGWKLVAREGRRRWKDGNLAMRQAMRAFGLAENDVFTLEPLGVTAFEKLAGKGRVRDFMASHTEKKGSLALVPASDKREAVAVGTLAEFEDVTTGDSEND